MLEILLHIFIGDDVPSLRPAPAKQRAFELKALIYNFGLLFSEKKNPTPTLPLQGRPPALVSFADEMLEPQLQRKN